MSEPAPTPSRLAISVPAGVVGGQQLTVEHNGQTLSVTVPDGLQAGATFEIAVPAAAAVAPAVAVSAAPLPVVSPAVPASNPAATLEIDAQGGRQSTPSKMEKKKGLGLAVSIAKKVDSSLLEWNRPVLLAFLIFSIVFTTVVTLMVIKLNDCTVTTVLGTAFDQMNWRSKNPHVCVMYNTFLISMEAKEMDGYTGSKWENNNIVTAAIGQVCYPPKGEGLGLDTPDGISFPSVIKGRDTAFCGNDVRNEAQRFLLDDPDFKFKDVMDIYDAEKTHDLMVEWGPCPTDGETVFSTKYVVCADKMLAIGSAFGFAAPVKAVTTTLVVALMSLFRCIKRVRSTEPLAGE